MQRRAVYEQIAPSTGFSSLNTYLGNWNKGVLVPLMSMSKYNIFYFIPI